MTDRKQINIKIKSDKADRWEQTVQDNPEYSSMTDLIRQSVSKEIAGNSDSPTQPNPEVGKDMAEMKDQMNNLNKTVEMLSDTISELRGDIRNQSPSDKHLRSEIFASLPTEGIGSTPEEIAHDLGEPIDSDTVERVLENLYQDVGSVGRGIGPTEGEIRYMKQD